jgi:nucleoside-specific outer membrane channel protein Tsx
LSGKAYVGYGEAELAVSLDKTSSWHLTGDTTLKSFTNADMSFSNVESNGFSSTYDLDAPANKPLKGRIFRLSGGGTVLPAWP